MSNTQRDSRNAVAYIGGKPVLELAADLYTYPIQTPDDAHKLYVSMAAYDSYSVKKFYDQVLPKRKRRSTTEATVEPHGTEDLRAFVMKHFRGFIGAELEDGSEPSLAQQTQWLEENPVFVERIFNLGMNVVGPRVKPDELRPGGKAILLFGSKEQRVPIEFRLYSPERMVEESFPIVAVIDKLTQSDKHKYDKATAIIENSRRGETFLEGNWDVIEQLCDQRIKRLEGPVVIEGEPCTESNKTAWVERLPMIYKIYIMGQAVQSIEIKNG